MEDALKAYATALECTTDEASAQLLHPDGLESSLNRPQTYAHYQDADLAMQAAALAHGIAEGQHFVEGNKRAAWAALRLFLLRNGYDVQATPQERASWIVELSGGRTIEQFAAQLRERIVEL